LSTARSAPCHFTAHIDAPHRFGREDGDISWLAVFQAVADAPISASPT